MPHDVFISYSSHDKAVADATCAAIEAQKIRCWIAPRDVLAGTEYGESIVNAIEDCRAMVLVFSDHANKSPHIRREVERAVSKGKFIVPFRIEDVLPSGALEYCLGSTHWLDALTPPMEKRIGELVESVGRLLCQQVSPPPNSLSHSEPEDARRQTATQVPSQTTPTPSSVRSLKGPSLALMLVGGLFVCITTLAAIGTGADIGKNGFKEEGSIAGSIMVVLAFCCNGVAVLAGFNMAKARHYRLCFAGTLLLMPGTFLLGTPVSIWAIRALLQPGVRSAFERSVAREKTVREKPVRKGVTRGQSRGLLAAIGLSIASGLQVFFFICTVIVLGGFIVTKKIDSQELTSNWLHSGVMTCAFVVIYLIPGVLGLLSLKRPGLRYAVALVNGLVAGLLLFAGVVLAFQKEWLIGAVEFLAFLCYAGTSVLFYRASKSGIAVLGDAVFFNRRGSLRFVQGEINLAIEDFTKAIALDAKFAFAFLNRAVAYRDLGQSQQAMDDLQKAVELEPKDATCYYLRGCVLMELGEYENAIADFSLAIGLKPQLKDAYVKRADCYSKLGESEKAASDSVEASRLRLSTYSGTKVSRNDRCPCGSNKQFKYCCGLYFSS